jgi:hypothetical protein
MGSVQQQRGKGVVEKGLPDSSSSTEKVVVAVKASKEISRTALVWALRHVVQPGDCIILLVLIPPQSTGLILILLFYSFDFFIFLFFCC